MREALAERLGRMRGIQASARCIVVVNGSQQVIKTGLFWRDVLNVSECYSGEVFGWRVR